jgi:hypothetical protein
VLRSESTFSEQAKPLPWPQSAGANTATLRTPQLLGAANLMQQELKRAATSSKRQF